MTDDALHAWLLRAGPVTVPELMAELESLRDAQPAAYGDLPTNGIQAIEALKRLQVAGKATCDGIGVWRYAEPAKKAERRLF